jgi:hypothetical protein
MKIRLTALIIIFCILCTGCAAETEPQRYWEYSDDGQYFFYDIKNVMAFAKSDLAPEGFANPHCLKSIGEYGEYFVLSSDYQSYFYTLIDANMVHNHLWIRHGKNYGAIFSDLPVLDINDANGSLLRLKHSESGIIVWNDITYRYFKGELGNVYWRIGDVEFSLGLDDAVSYPLDGKSTFITQITSLSEFKRTIAMKRFLWNYRLYS